MLRIIYTCAECDREFDMLKPNEAAEWADGHDCEPDAPKDAA